MNKLEEVIQFVAQQVETAEEKLQDGFQVTDLLAFVTTATQLPLLLSKKNRSEIANTWKETRVAEGGMEQLRDFIKTTVTMVGKGLEAKIEKASIIVFDTLDLIGEFHHAAA